MRRVRTAQGIAQEEFDVVSSRTYVSALERGLKQPTLPKIDELAGVLKVHPLTLLAFSYCDKSPATDLQSLLARVEREARAILERE